MGLYESSTSCRLSEMRELRHSDYNLCGDLGTIMGLIGLIKAVRMVCDSKAEDTVLQAVCKPGIASW
jgi:hypothetical protein